MTVACLNLTLSFLDSHIGSGSDAAGSCGTAAFEAPQPMPAARCPQPEGCAFFGQHSFAKMEFFNIEKLCFRKQTQTFGRDSPKFGCR